MAPLAIKPEHFSPLIIDSIGYQAGWHQAKSTGAHSRCCLCVCMGLCACICALSEEKVRQFGCCCGWWWLFQGCPQMDTGLGGCQEQVTFNFINISISLFVCRLSISLSFCLSFFSSPGRRKIKVFCFLCKIFVFAFWFYLKIKLSLIRCLSFQFL